MKLKLVLIYSLLFFVHANAQKNKIDSLRKAVLSANDTGKVITLIIIGREHFNGESDSSTKYFDKALQLADEINYPKGTKEAYIAYSIYHFLKSDFDKSISVAEKVFTIEGPTYTKVTDADAYMLMANGKLRKGLYDKALTDYLTALQIYEKFKNPKREAMIANNIGNIYYEQERYKEAIKYFERSIELKTKFAGEEELITPYSNLGNCYNALKDSMNALRIHKKNLEICLRSGNPFHIATGYQNLGVAYYGLGDYKRSLDYKLKSLNIFRNTDYLVEATSCYLGIAQVFGELKDYKKALIYADSARVIADSTNFLFNLNMVYKNMSEFHKLLGNYKESLFYFEKATAIHDSMLDEKVNKTVTEMQSKYDSEKKDIEIQMQKTEIEKQNTQRNGFIIGSGLLLLLLIFILRGFYQKKKDNKIIMEQKKEVEQQKTLIEEHQKEMIDSIHYAKRIQIALMPSDRYIEKHLDELKKKK